MRANRESCAPRDGASGSPEAARFTGSRTGTPVFWGAETDCGNPAHELVRGLSRALWWALTKTGWLRAAGSLRSPERRQRDRGRLPYETATAACGSPTTPVTRSSCREGRVVEGDSPGAAGGGNVKRSSGSRRRVWIGWASELKNTGWAARCIPDPAPDPELEQDAKHVSRFPRLVGGHESGAQAFPQRKIGHTRYQERPSLR